MAIFVRYSYFTWRPPRLSAQEELDLGKRIALVGREQFEKEFRKSLAKTGQTQERAKHGIASWPQEVRYVIIIVFLGGIFLFLAEAGVANEVIISCIPMIVIVGLIYYGSLFFAMRRFKAWANYLVAKYAEHAAGGERGNECVAVSPADVSAHTPVKTQLVGDLAFANECFAKGICYATGQGIVQNYEQALKWYMKAATAGPGLAEAQTNLGMMYSNGQGVAKDYVESAKWFLKAAMQGEPTAQYNLGLFYAEGCGVDQNYQEAVKWTRKSAEQGNAGAMNNLAVFYLKGTGVPQDTDQALQLLQKAADAGYEIAKRALATISENASTVNEPKPKVSDSSVRIDTIVDSTTGLIRYKQTESHIVSSDGLVETEEIRIRKTVAVSPETSFEDASKRSLSFYGGINQAKRVMHYDHVRGKGVVSDFGNEYEFPKDGSTLYINTIVRKAQETE